MRRGYRGFLREMLRTGSLRSLGLQLGTGVLHAARRAWDRQPRDAVALFFERYGPDGFRPRDPELRELQLAAEGCLVCGLCSLECARVGGRPRLDPRDAILSAARLETDLIRLAIGGAIADACASCAACAAVCPAGIPIHRMQTALGKLGDLTPRADPPPASAASASAKG